MGLVDVEVGYCRRRRVLWTVFRPIDHDLGSIVVDLGHYTEVAAEVVAAEDFAAERFESGIAVGL